ncbi:MAG: YidC/Oxa1 family membrane protein insertase [bacterium]|nr:YidC/Oxa1 family membrane protein insertase [bacterium]
MDTILSLFHTIFSQPLFNALVFLTGQMPFHDLGLAIIILTILVRFIIFPFTHRSIVTQIQMRKIEPEIKKIRETHKNNQQEIAQKTMALYKAHGVSPFSGCLMLLIQFPVLIALYTVFINSIPDSAHTLYSFVILPEMINVHFLSLVNLTKASFVIAFLAGLSQFIQMRLAIPPSTEKKTTNASEDITKRFMKQAQYIFPVFIIVISLRFPAALALYWTTSNIFAILHEGVVRKRAFVLAKAKE